MSADSPSYEPTPDASYSLDVIAKITGVETQTILHYQGHGFIANPEQGHYDDSTLRVLRRIDYLQTHYEMSLSGIKLLLTLMEEVERLQRELRSRAGGVSPYS